MNLQHSNEICKLKQQIYLLKQSRDMYSNDNEESETMDFEIQNYSNEMHDNNNGCCPYCPKTNLKSVAIHIGHNHKCKTCSQLAHECICKRGTIRNNIKKFQANSIIY